MIVENEASWTKD